MKNKLFLFILFTLFVGGTFAQAQTIKLGYVDSRGVSEQLPEVKAAYSQLNDFSKAKENELRKDATDLQRRIEEYQQGADKMAEPMRAATEKELQAAQEKLQVKQSAAQTEIANKEKQIFDPIEKRIQEAIKQVATENGYTYVFAKEVLLHFPTTDDISSLVVKKLQASAPKPTTPTTTPPATTKPSGTGTAPKK